MPLISTRPSGGAASSHSEAASNHGETRSKEGKASSPKGIGRSGPWSSLFSIAATFHCDANGFVWMNTTITWSFWINHMYFFKNVPIGSATGMSRTRTSHVGAKEIARLMKRAFFEFVAYTYAWGGPTFKNVQTSDFELVSQDRVALRYGV